MRDDTKAADTNVLGTRHSGAVRMDPRHTLLLVGYQNDCCAQDGILGGVGV